MGTRETFQRTLGEACCVLGNESVLSARIGHPLPQVLDWIFGRQPVPVDVFLAAVDIIVASNRKFIADTDVFLEEVRRRNGLSAHDLS